MASLDENETPQFINVAYGLTPEQVYKFELDEKNNFFCECRYLTEIITLDNTVINREAPILVPHTKNDNFPDDKAYIEAFEFIMTYMGKKEREFPALEAPINDSKIRDWMKKSKDEDLFKPYTTRLNDDALKQIQLIVIIANYLDMPVLINKLCSLIASSMLKKHNVIP